MANFLKVGAIGDPVESAIDWSDIENKPLPFLATIKRGDQAENGSTRTQYKSDYAFDLTNPNVYVAVNGKSYFYGSGRFTLVSTTVLQFASACSSSDEIVIIVLSTQGTAEPVWDSNTVLLCKFDKLIKDVTEKNELIPSSAFLIDSSVKKYGDSSVYFDGTKYIDICNRGNFDFGGNEFCIESWIRIKSHSIGGIIFNQWNYTANDKSYILYITSDEKINFVYSVNGTNDSYTLAYDTALALDTWYHVCVERNNLNDSIKLYVNGDEKDSENSSGVTLFSASELPRLGCKAGGTSDYYKGYLDDFRVSDIARYRGNFTPPTSL